MNKRGAEMVEYAIVLACIAAVGVAFYSADFSRWQWYRDIRILLIIQLKFHEMIHCMSRKCGLSMPKKKNGQ